MQVCLVPLEEAYDLHFFQQLIYTFIFLCFPYFDKHQIKEQFYLVHHDIIRQVPLSYLLSLIYPIHLVQLQHLNNLFILSSQ